MLIMSEYSCTAHYFHIISLELYRITKVNQFTTTLAAVFNSMTWTEEHHCGSAVAGSFEQQSTCSLWQWSVFSQPYYQGTVITSLQEHCKVITKTIMLSHYVSCNISLLCSPPTHLKNKCNTTAISRACGTVLVSLSLHRAKDFGMQPTEMSLYAVLQKTPTICSQA